ncbi:hypothetical protein M8542_15125 [Amycolatopsis sp. OK19-0408]|uniref:Uncharacterized protein n=1 Tax=Amycolatopsis iheyensis TaxID=2945988 RepID=A0A9X2NAU4_9PSEU|nr:hypothetical protein [Amycolatopsis iheyensis]MCR6484153.1 hypothetical protein [Amycolatopsis iheyensis]
MSELTPRLRDEIDDQVAEAFDACLADRLAERGPLRDALRGRRTWPLWVAIVLTNLAWLVAASR